MSNRMKMLIGAGILACGFAGTASALPLAPLQNSPRVAAANVEAARLICPPYRPCYRVFGGYGRGYGYGRRYGYGRPYGYGRGYGYGYGRPFYRSYGY